MIATSCLDPYLPFLSWVEQYFSTHIPAVSCPEQDVNSEQFCFRRSTTQARNLPACYFSSRNSNPVSCCSPSSTVPRSATLVSVLFLVDRHPSPGPNRAKKISFEQKTFTFRLVSRSTLVPQTGSFEKRTRVFSSPNPHAISNISKPLHLITEIQLTYQSPTPAPSNAARC